MSALIALVSLIGRIVWEAVRRETVFSQEAVRFGAPSS